MRISVIHPSELGPAEVTAWQDMQRRSAGLRNPFLSARSSPRRLAGTGRTPGSRC